MQAQIPNLPALASSAAWCFKASTLLAAMANAKRLEILRLLLEKEYSVGELAEVVMISQPALSQHLAKLRGLRLVTIRKEAQTVFYRCNSRQVFGITEVLEKLIDD